MALAGVLLFAVPAQSASLTIKGMNGTNTASATFSLLDNSTLQVTLTNTSVNGATSFNDVLTGFFFSSNVETTTPTRVEVASSSAVVNCPNCSTATDISSHYLYASSVGGLNGAEAANVIGANSFGFLTQSVGNTPVLPGANNGVAFGLVSSNTSFGQSLFTGSPLVSTSVIITYNLNNGGFDLNTVSGGFLWGTMLVPLNSDLSFGMYAASPEPGTFLMLGLGLAGAIAARRRMARKTRT